MNALVTSLLLVSCYFLNANAQTDPPCEPCAALKCKDGQNCTREPVVRCPPLGICRGKIVKDRCGCCDICVTTIGHKCRDDHERFKEQVCGDGLRCVPVEESLSGFEIGIEKRRSCRCEKETTSCFDPVNKKSYQPGEIWTRGDFACEVCVCNSNGQLKCSSLRCRKSTCTDFKRVEDRCCPFCMRDDWSKGCEYDGSMYFDGEVVVLQDQKSICKCKKKKWSCNRDPHHGFTDISEKPQCIDEVSDEPIRMWSMWLPSECSYCLCGNDGLGNCSMVNCANPRCEDSFKIKGRCCPVCPEDFQTMCNYAGQKYMMGDKTVLPDRCTICTCENSRWQCSSKGCKGSKFLRGKISKHPSRFVGIEWEPGDKKHENEAMCKNILPGMQSMEQ